jgi:DNA-binding transcriptional ArsR family regulator
MTRPAVSQHLKVLRAAGLVLVRAEGTRRLYTVDTSAASDGLRSTTPCTAGDWRRSFKRSRATYKVTDEDFAAARASGLTEDQVFELVVCAAVVLPSGLWPTAS